jgi:hypothetical protein
MAITAQIRIPDQSIDIKSEEYTTYDYKKAK